MSSVIISNGYGEDAIGAAIARVHKPVTAVSLIGDGAHYSAASIPVEAPFPVLPSGGFIRTLSDALGDIRTGLGRTILSQNRLLRRILSTADYAIVVGDIWCLLMTRWAYKGPLYFLPTAKSHRFMRHSRLECWLMRRYCQRVFPRDEETTADLIQSDIPAHYAGNMLMILPPPVPTDYLDKTCQYIGILPGSRQEAYANFDKILSLLPAGYTLLVSLPPQLDRDKLQSLLNKHPLESVIVCSMTTLVINSGLVIGLAGTANEQAVMYNQRVITFVGAGPQTTAQRLTEQQQLLGSDRLIIVPDTPDAVATAIKTHWHPPVPIQWETMTPERISQCIIQNRGGAR